MPTEHIKFTLLAAVLFLMAVTASQAANGDTVEVLASDGVKVYGEVYAGDLEENSPLILLFHQGGSNGRGEYSPLVPWLNDLGFRVIAWDQRSGGATYGSDNRTKGGLTSSEGVSYCDAYPDLQAGLDYVLNNELAEQVVVWGSSYSAALVFRLAADNPDRVAKIVAASPARSARHVGHLVLGRRLRAARPVA
ncbi:MAG: alpha/beta fold hydrolase, partial [Pseudomonadota bacterium]